MRVKLPIVKQKLKNVRASKNGYQMADFFKKI